LIVDAKHETVFRDSRITRLSQGVDASMTLTAKAMARSFEVLSDYRTIMDEAGVSRGLLVATSAVRDASNGDDFLDEARRRAGVDAKILSGHEEAAYSYAGATSGLESDPRATVIVDVGGGSTELAVMVDGVLESYSMQLGCVRVTERALGKGVVNERRRDAATAMIAEQLDHAWQAVPAFATLGDVRLIGLAGSVSTLVQLDARMGTYDRDLVHHRRISTATVREWRDRLANELPEVRLARPGMIRGREDVLPAGLYVLAAVMERLGVDELLSSESDILDGIASSLLP
jgi:exopolyphosphatase/guanosine-5'-triphosphate,3'-diphosphate pyrophosphatase